jgi:hypothetical protein
VGLPILETDCAVEQRQMQISWVLPMLKTSEGLRIDQPGDGFDGIADVAEAARLFAVSVHGDRGAFECLLHKCGKHHAVARVCLGPTVGLSSAARVSFEFRRS